MDSQTEKPTENGIFVSDYAWKKIQCCFDEHGIYFRKGIDKKSCFSYLRLIDDILFFQVKEECEKYITDVGAGDRMDHSKDILCVEIDPFHFELWTTVPISFIEEHLLSIDIRADIHKFIKNRKRLEKMRS